MMGPRGGAGKASRDDWSRCTFALMSGPLVSALASAIHLGSLAGGVACIFFRAQALDGELDQARLQRLFRVDNIYGLLSITWIGSGLWRALGDLEKGPAYYLGNHVFWGKMLLIGFLMGCEMLPMFTFIRWRIRLQKGLSIDTSRVALIRKLHWAELAGVALIIPMASMMARGIGTPRAAPPREDPLAAEIATGEKIYGQRCVTCHQADGHGLAGKLAADFVGDKSRLGKDDAALLRSIELGVPGTAMRAFGGELDDPQRRAVLAFVRRRFGEK